ncbi:MAG: hypothetical protein A3C84_02595 [Candidatus Ryanbacteria bacterium RIFCSPHIGHO2_02_FULL_48_12]|uniref:RecF/RecN/SMC N-terminal domain-containing protein n=1 Tax=Candidatus Ryanbacteria bacterium RIFCSPHIGHO2_01_FULL_48_27 TaxID=1802115 RepID=A0A1G2G4M4_9BACT|nr:MAG: hypothetical protein A2756_01070 [Candidatus Ryanbacteria bacterium RIFCSPHIGHO2_01_FULL_48_27]OGZ49001.1 MAG: hypothetical protein A3C84_02595 [Candidatus Ryanbacteria bacterium RIFCSPHIGHO2_02_FULL_48_12]
MRLKKIEIAGFKSFARHVTLEFPTPVVAIVGPNGSGKSNVSEAMRWVLGEQSMKSLRGKRGEDLIFHGSGGASQLGKAMVRITLDNTDRVLPVDFEEVAISREVYRDGANEYKVNGSLVRLKDIIEILSKVGIGGSGHHIISQGEADRILYSSPRERKRMLEDALGLKIYEIKRMEAERKLEATEVNMREVEVVRREIQPHMRFLKVQADKVEASSKFREELKNNLVTYLAKERETVRRDQERLHTAEDPLREEEARMAGEIAELRKNLSTAFLPDNATMLEMRAVEVALTQLDAKHRSFERELGRIEGQLAFFASKRHGTAPLHATVPLSDVAHALGEILTYIETALHSSSFEAFRTQILDLKQHTQKYLHKISEPADAHEEVNENMGELEAEQQKIKTLIQGLEAERKTLAQKRAELEAAYGEAQGTYRVSGERLRSAEEAQNRIKDAIRALAVDAERIKIRAAELSAQETDAVRFLGDTTVPDTAHPFEVGEREELRRKIDRLKIKLEEIGGIDESVLKEYNEIAEREAFLAGELKDLEGTAVSLHALMGELQQNLEREFVQGVERINDEFSKLFTTMFGGGEARLKMVEAQKRKAKDAEVSDEDEELEDVESGVDIAVDLPRKRVKNLDMLSGGERALTSIALLFAMSAVNPPPFLVLDETDAALDEANSQRYGAMLKDLSKKAQLVVITHNRQTMKEAGVLYGVTMGADGVSKLLSIKFEEAREVASR